MTSAAPPAGALVRSELSKWGGQPHWAAEATALGEDEHGTWLGFPGGTTYTRPGHTYLADRDHVSLVPVPLGAHVPWHLATFYRTPGNPWPALGDSGVQVYVDVTTPPEWDGVVLRAVDLDLDVVRGFNGTVIIDDEDEFLEHQTTFGYPAEVIAAARASAEEVRAAVVEGRAPYDGSHLPWLERLAELTRSSG